MKTIETYAQAILEYLALNANENGMDLKTTNRSDLREYLAQLVENGCTENDLRVIQHGLKLNLEVNGATIRRCSAEEFRSVENFIKGKTAKPSTTVVELAAVLAQFPLRPYAKYRNSYENITFEKTDNNNTYTEIVKTLNPNEKSLHPKEQRESTSAKKRKITWRQGIGITGFLGILCWGISSFLNQPECMQWQENRYVLVACQKSVSPGEAPVVGYQKEEFNQRKVELQDSTVFFKNGKPLYFYCKVNGTPEFFIQDGNHPVYQEKQLMAISGYIVQKYLVNKKEAD
ncbi:hypothetical protein [Flavobacterium sp.]|jgi:hypothetical protein|uniref:hypothetical protein n=1 Tax=Flavobacterium sp. TaxID=239 RepID=UPI0022C23B8A|nr:hypothetical protein [Flavobacterium sp.]MCZ8144642.1 hypothetical protein [Flavobacterium sp.]MCZ8368138.1 hypothetical protein [Flavobacterium sp.]